MPVIAAIRERGQVFGEMVLDVGERLFEPASAEASVLCSRALALQNCR